jgi:hypothetical protein
MRAVRRHRTALVAAAAFLAWCTTTPALAASTRPIEGAYYDNCRPTADHCVQILAFPDEHKVDVVVSGAAGCYLEPEMPSSTRLRSGNRFAATGTTAAFDGHPAQKIRVAGHFTSRRKAVATYSDCHNRTHHLILPYRGLAGLGP